MEQNVTEVRESQELAMAARDLVERAIDVSQRLRHRHDEPPQRVRRAGRKAGGDFTTPRRRPA